MTWYEDQSYAPVVMQTLKCPVCKSELGQRSPEDRKWMRCDECKADHYYPPNMETPTRSRVDSMSHGKRGCGCGRCGG
jgi:hypothetical protein